MPPKSLGCEFGQRHRRGGRVFFLLAETGGDARAEQGVGEFPEPPRGRWALQPPPAGTRVARLALKAKWFGFIRLARSPFLLFSCPAAPAVVPVSGSSSSPLPSCLSFRLQSVHPLITSQLKVRGGGCLVPVAVCLRLLLLVLPVEPDAWFFFFGFFLVACVQSVGTVKIKVLSVIRFRCLKL